MSLRMIVLSIMLTFMLASEALAVDANGRYARYTTPSCGTFADSYQKQLSSPMFGKGLYTSDYAPFYFMIMGWISGYNSATPDTFDLIHNDTQLPQRWIYDYCLRNPNKSLGDALASFAEEFYEQRER